jgi:cob(I)alamin adenosyltransferase
VEACGDVDELSACLGILASTIPEGQEIEVMREIRKIQSSLLHAGARLSMTPGAPLLSSVGNLGEEDIRWLEQTIDRMDGSLPPLTGFILPGGHPCAAFAHLARTVCRRAERRVAALVKEKGEEGGARTILTYLNRLSDYLFLLARCLNMVAGFSDIPWEKR